MIPGAVAVMALERIPADIRYDGGVARMSDPDMIKSIKDAVTIPVMAKVLLTEYICHPPTYRQELVILLRRKF